MSVSDQLNRIPGWAFWIVVTAIILVTVVFATGCQSVGPRPAPPVTQSIFQQSELDVRSATIGAFLVHGFPVTQPVRVSGQGTLTLQYPAMPHFIVDGQLVLEPIPLYESETRQAISDGRMLILRSGKPSAMVPVGTIER